MGKREIQKEKKIALLELIKERKAVLFGNFKTTTNIEKQKAWEDVLLKAKSLEMANSEKTWTYARDSLFGLWKSRTLSKRDNMRKTGTGGGKAKILDEVDLIILEIIGNNNTVVDGLDLPESGSNVLLPLDNKDNEDILSTSHSPLPLSIVTADNSSKYVGANTNNSVQVNQCSRKRKGESSSSNKKRCIEEANELKVDLLKVEIYHRKLQILKLEEELGIPNSEFTRDIVKNV